MFTGIRSLLFPGLAATLAAANAAAVNDRFLRFSWQAPKRSTRRPGQQPSNGKLTRQPPRQPTRQPSWQPSQPATRQAPHPYESGGGPARGIDTHQGLPFKLVVEPILWHWLIMFVFLASFILHIWVLPNFIDEMALEDPAQTQTVQANILDMRTYTERTRRGYTYTCYEIKYDFTVAGDPTVYSNTDETGRTYLWTAVTASEYTRLLSASHCEVLYLRRNPWHNKPASQLGQVDTGPLLILAAVVFVNLIGVSQMTLAYRNYGRCKKAAEAGQLKRMNFWKVTRVPIKRRTR